MLLGVPVGKLQESQSSGVLGTVRCTCSDPCALLCFAILVDGQDVFVFGSAPLLEGKSVAPPSAGMSWPVVCLSASIRRRLLSFDRSGLCLMA